MNAEGYGAKLRETRELAGLTVQQAAERLHCDPMVVEALESESVAALGAAVFVRGHLRRYAEFLQLPAQELLAMYQATTEVSASAPDLTRIARAERQRDANRALRWLYVIGAGAVGAFVVWSVLQSPRGATTAPETEVTTAVASLPVPAEQVASAAVTETTTSMPASARAAQAAPSPSVPAAAASPAAAATPLSSDVVKLAFRASADCWTEVYDFEGRQLYFDTVRSGSRHEVSGKGPLKLLIGNTDGIRLELGGKELRIPAELQRKGTAYLSLAADGRMERAQ